MKALCLCTFRSPSMTSEIRKFKRPLPPIYAQTALPVFDLLRTIEDNLGIDKNSLRKSIFPFTAHHDQLNRARDLGCRQADPWFAQHCLNQIVDESLQV